MSETFCFIDEGLPRCYCCKDVKWNCFNGGVPRVSVIEIDVGFPCAYTCMKLESIHTHMRTSCRPKDTSIQSRQLIAMNMNVGFHN